MEKDTGYASAGLGSNHPEVKRRIDEIIKVAEQVTQDEKAEAIFNFAQIKWHRLNTATESFKPETDQMNVISGKEKKR